MLRRDIIAISEFAVGMPKPSCHVAGARLVRLLVILFLDFISAPPNFCTLLSRLLFLMSLISNQFPLTLVRPLRLSSRFSHCGDRAGLGAGKGRSKTVRGELGTELGYDEGRWLEVRDEDGSEVGAKLGGPLGSCLGNDEGLRLGRDNGCRLEVGLPLGSVLGWELGIRLGSEVGCEVVFLLGSELGDNKVSRSAFCWDESWVPRWSPSLDRPRDFRLALSKGSGWSSAQCSAPRWALRLDSRSARRWAPPRDLCWASPTEPHLFWVPRSAPRWDGPRSAVQSSPPLAEYHPPLAQFLEHRGGGEVISPLALSLPPSPMNSPSRER